MASENPTVFSPSSSPSPVTFSKYSKRVLLKTILERDDGGLSFVDQKMVIGGWVKSSKEVVKDPPAAPAPASGDRIAEVKHRDLTCIELIQTRIPIVRSIIKIFYGNNYHSADKLETVVHKPPLPSAAFLVVNDGSCVASLQVVIESSLHHPSLLLPTGTCILVEGVLKRAPVPGKHIVHLEVEKILHVGKVEQERYPLSKKRMPMDILRKFSYFRPRTTTVASIMRLRNALTFATHTFFQNHGFLYVQLPTITTTDNDGFSEKFNVTTLIGKTGRKVEPTEDNETDGVSLETVKAAVKEKGNLVKELERSESNKEALLAAVQDLQKTNELALQLEARAKSKSKSKPDKLNLREDFFSQETYLTVSGQLHLESYACALGSVYSCGPRFRADKTESRKNAAEMWMVEVEIAFAQLEDAMNCADDLVKFLSKEVLSNCLNDMKFIQKRVDKMSIHRLESFISSSFEKISYTAAREMLEKSQMSDKKSQHLQKLESGAALTADHLSYLADEICKKPVIVYDYPKETKPFNVRLNDDGKTVAAFDVVLPKAGVVISGSQKEERLDMLMRRIKELGLPREQYDWYLEILKHGTVKHSGFSLAFDRFVLFTTGLTDIKDAIPFPRSFGKASD